MYKFGKRMAKLATKFHGVQIFANFLWLVGTGGANIYNTMYPNDGTQNSLLGVNDNNLLEGAEQRKLDDVLKKFDEHCLPQRNIATESYKFNVIHQKEKQTFTEFETELRTQVLL